MRRWAPNEEIRSNEKKQDLYMKKPELIIQFYKKKKFDTER